MEQRSEEEHKNQKQQGSKEPIEVFICSCRKEYNSFPALYLHNKNKHDVTLRTKEKSKMKRKVVWSGNKKKLVYQFPQESEESDGEQKFITKKSKRTLMKKIKLKQQQNKNKLMQRKSLEQVFLEFLKFAEKEKIFSNSFKGLQALLYQLSNFIINDDRSNSFLIEQNLNISTNKVQLVPFYLNQFTDQILPKLNYFNLQQQLVFSFLGSLSDWMYVNNYSTSLAVLNQKNNIKTEYEYFMKIQPMLTTIQYQQPKLEFSQANLHQNQVKTQINEQNKNIKIQVD